MIQYEHFYRINSLIINDHYGTLSQSVSCQGQTPADLINFHTEDLPEQVEHKPASVSECFR